MTKIARRPWVRVQFQSAVLIDSAAGVIIKVHGVPQSILEIQGSGTAQLSFRIQRAIWRHTVTFEYNSAVGNIRNTSGDPLGDVPQTPVTNNLPQFTTFDWTPGAADPIDTDTKFDVVSPGVDTCRHDEV